MIVRQIGATLRPMAQDLIIPLRRPQAYRFYHRLAWRGPRRVRIAFDDRSIDLPLQLILKQARAVKSRIGHEGTLADSLVVPTHSLLRHPEFRSRLHGAQPLGDFSGDRVPRIRVDDWFHMLAVTLAGDSWRFTAPKAKLKLVTTRPQFWRC